jgi:hypothetical protein
MKYWGSYLPAKFSSLSKDPFFNKTIGLVAGSTSQKKLMARWLLSYAMLSL